VNDYDVYSGELDMIKAYIEIIPYDLDKYEFDKKSGFILKDRLQASSSYPPIH